VFVLENGLMGERTGTGIFNGTNRQSYAGLAGGFGTVAFGRQYTPQHLFTAAVDPFGKSGLGSASNVLVQDARLNNLAAYISPNWGGFSFVAGYTFNGTGLSVPSAPLVTSGNENLANDGDVRVWAIAPTFTWNKLFLGANYHTAQVYFRGADNVKAFNAWDFFASYDFGVAKVGATIGQRRTKRDLLNVVGAPGTGDAKILQWMVGATFRITPNDSILASYNYARQNDFADAGKAKLSQWAVGYEHALSKRTVLYAQFAMQDKNGKFRDHGNGFATVSTSPAVKGSVATSYDGSDDTRGYRRGLALGFRHDF
jgi:predicted porin